MVSRVVASLELVPGELRGGALGKIFCLRLLLLLVLQKGRDRIVVHIVLEVIVVADHGDGSDRKIINVVQMILLLTTIGFNFHASLDRMPGTEPLAQRRSHGIELGPVSLFQKLRKSTK
jgi:hypothetical protein